MLMNEMEKKLRENSRFKEKDVKIGVIVAIRASESLDRRVVLKQGDYGSGRYGTQYGCGVFSPFMDLTTEDLWKITTLCDLDANSIYSMFWDSGVPLAKMRIGSPLNTHSGDSVKLYKVLNPSTYGKMIGRLNGVDFVASYGGVFNNGFKYIKLDQPTPFFDGIVDSPSLCAALNYIDVSYTLRDTNAILGSDETTAVHTTSERPVHEGENIRLTEILPKFARLIAADKAREAGDEEKAKYFEENIPKIKTWYDYAKELVNNAEPMFYKSWAPKLKTSIKHWAKNGSAVNEATIDAYRVISNRQDRERFGYDATITEEDLHWAEGGKTEITRKPILRVFRYPQDCSENLARMYMEDIRKRWNEGGREEFESNQFLYSMFFSDHDDETKATFSDGTVNHKRGSYLRRTLCNHGGSGGAAEMLSEWGPSADEIRTLITGSGKDVEIHWKDGASKAAADPKKTSDGVLYNDKKTKVPDECISDKYDYSFWVTYENICRRYFADKVRESASWKRVTIACLRSDIKMTYMGFSQSAEEKMIRANAEAAFASSEEERKKKIAEYERAKAKMEAEKEAED